MKTKSLILISLISLFSGLANAAVIDLKCEEGVGNVYDPEQYLHVSGNLDVSVSGVLNYNQKNNLKVQVFSSDGKPVFLASTEYEASVQVGSGELQFSVKTVDGKEVRVRMVEDFPQVFVKVFHGKTFFLGKEKLIGSGVCWGGNPILLSEGQYDGEVSL